jgi:hypothetical protein
MTAADRAPDRKNACPEHDLSPPSPTVLDLLFEATGHPMTAADRAPDRKNTCPEHDLSPPSPAASKSCDMAAVARLAEE